MSQKAKEKITLVSIILAYGLLFLIVGLSVKLQALAKRDECSDGKLTVEEYVAWMEGCFPNRTSKT